MLPVEDPMKKEETLPRLIRAMGENAARIQQLAQDVPAEQARWRPDSESWSLLEVIAHLLDEEREDFRVRLDIILHRPQAPWPPIDPQGWVQAHHYNDRDLPQTLDAFLEEREHSRQWLRSLKEPNWDSVYEARFGPIRAGDMLAAWATHDLLHLRQLVELHYAYLQTLVAPYSSRYAGDW